VVHYRHSYVYPQRDAALALKAMLEVSWNNVQQKVKVVDAFYEKKRKKN
jgi:hypothetical protein